MTGGTTITGASVLGEPVTIDATGVHPRGDRSSNPLVGSLADGLNGVLANVGVTVTLAGPVRGGGTTVGQLASSGLRIDLELSNRTIPALSGLIDGLPAFPDLVPGVPSVADVLAAAQARHLARLEVAPAAVSLSASSLTAEVATPISDGTAIGGDYPSLGDDGTFPSGLTSPPLLSTGTGTVPASSRNPPVPRIPFGAGVGALGLLVLLAQPLVGARLARIATAVLALDDPASCPREGR
jgi:hypothetical protein